MKAVVRKRQTSKLSEIDKKPLQFEIRGHSVELKKVDRWMKRNDIQQSILYHPSPAADTLSAVRYWTANSASSPADSIRTEEFSAGGAASILQTPQPFSPTSPISSILQLAFSSFVGQSSAPIYQNSTTKHMGLGQAEHRYGDADEARLRHTLNENETLYGTNHWKYRYMLKALGELMMIQGRYKSAEEISRKLVRIAQHVDGNDSNDMLEALELLGRVLTGEGLYSEVEKLFRRTSASSRKTQGLEHPYTLTSFANLALVLWYQGKYEAAEEMNRRALEGREKVLGVEHPETLISLGNLASVLQGQGKYEAAEEVNRRVLEGREKVLGVEHPHTLSSLNGLASVDQS